MTSKQTLLAVLVAGAFVSAHAATAPTPPLTSGTRAVAPAPVKAVDRIVAVVNKQVITQLDLDQRIKQALDNLQRQHVAPPEPEALKHQVLEQMITEDVQMQFAALNGINVDDADLERTISQIAKQNKVSVAGMYAQLAKDGVNQAQFRSDMRRDITLDRLKQREVESRVTVTDTEVDQVLKSANSANRSDYHLATILVSVPERASAKDIDLKSKRAETALADIKAGKPFAQVAATYSDAPNALKGGDLGWRPATSLPPELASLLDTLQPGDSSNVIRSPQGFYIFKLIEKRAQGAAQLVEQYHAEHILVRTNEAVSEADARSKIDQIRDRIARGASFEEMARLYSEDGSNTRGGDLGWVNLGDTVPEFEKAMVSLPLNQVSAPVRSPFGWHLIKVVGKRTQDVADQREKQAIKQQIRARKIEQAYLDWVRQLRDSAFVQERLDDNL